MKYLRMWFEWCESFRNKKLKDYQRIYEENNKRWLKESDDEYEQMFGDIMKEINR